LLWRMRDLSLTGPSLQVTSAIARIGVVLFNVQ
jgi:hypothetical protein